MQRSGTTGLAYTHTHTRACMRTHPHRRRPHTHPPPLPGLLLLVLSPAHRATLQCGRVGNTNKQTHTHTHRSHAARHEEDACRVTPCSHARSRGRRPVWCVWRCLPVGEVQWRARLQEPCRRTDRGATPSQRKGGGGRGRNGEGLRTDERTCGGEVQRALPTASRSTGTHGGVVRNRTGTGPITPTEPSRHCATVPAHLS
jgi:hypothetical protein